MFGIPIQAFLGQLLIGLINGAFYAMLSLGLAVIFGLLNIINFTHGAQYMLGAFCAWFLLEKAGLGYWWSLLVAPIVVGVTGVFTNYFGSSGQPYRLPDEFVGSYNLGFMFLPKYRAWVILASALVCFGTW